MHRDTTSSETTGSNTSHDPSPAGLQGTLAVELQLIVTDTELSAELQRHPEGRARHDFAIDAMRIGALALRRAQGRIDADVVRAEGEKLLAGIRGMLDDRQARIDEQLVRTLAEYFDPHSGRFHQRVQKLIMPDGELEQLLRRQLGGEDSELVKTLASHCGEGSPLLKMLDPNASNGLISSLATTVERTLGEQRELILRQFSLDNKEGALARLIVELREQHGDVSKELRSRIDAVVREFSLDHEESALSRLVRRVEVAQKEIRSQFSLDEENSALARMRRELMTVLGQHRTSGDVFQKDVIQILTEMITRKKEAERATRHGDDFESEVFDVVQSACQGRGDIATRTGSSVGLIKHCKVGDGLVELGPDHAAAGAKVVLEMKQNASYSLKDALDEIEKARKNRGAASGLFVFSRRTAPDGLEPIARYGTDVVVVWDMEDPRTDIMLTAGLDVARALCMHSPVSGDRAADFEAIDSAILSIEKLASGLDEITRFTETIKNNSEKILKRASLMRTGIAKDLEMLNRAFADLREYSSVT